MRRRKGGDHSLSALKSIRATRPEGAPIYVIMDNLSANKTRGTLPLVLTAPAGFRRNVEVALRDERESGTGNPVELRG
jgi:hypothetical protein